MSHLRSGTRFDLLCACTTHAEAPADFGKRLGLARESEALPDDATLPVVEPLQQCRSLVLHGEAFGETFIELGLLVGDDIPERRTVGRSAINRRVETQRPADRAVPFEQPDGVFIDARSHGDLFGGRWTTLLLCEVAPRASYGVASATVVLWQANEFVGTTLPVKRAPDPELCMGGEAHASTPVEGVNGPDEANAAGLHQVVGDPATADETAQEVRDEGKVRFDEAIASDGTFVDQLRQPVAIVLPELTVTLAE